MTRATTAQVLHLIEDATFENVRSIPGCTIAEIVKIADVSETTARKTVKALTDDGFVRMNGAEGRHRRFVAVPKQAAGEVKNMTDTAPNGAGRPRSADTLARDEHAMKLIADKPEGLTVAELAVALDVKTGIAYLSVWRLRNEGKVAKTATGDRTPRWAKA